VKVRLIESGEIVDLADDEARSLVREGRASLVEHPDARTSAAVHRDPTIRESGGKE